MVWLHRSNGLIYDTHSTQILQKQEDGCNTYAIMKTMCHPSYYHNECNSCTWAHDVWLCVNDVGSCCTHDAWSDTSCAQEHELPQSHCGGNRKGTLFSRLHCFQS